MPIDNGAALLRRRPDVREAERALAAATAQIGIATAALYPDVSLSASLGGAGTSPAALNRASGRTWSIGPLISWTFPNQAIARAQIRQSNASADAALASFDSSVLNALKETETALQNYARELHHLQALQQALQADQRALALARKLYEAGNTDLTSWLDAQRTVIAAQSQITTSQGDIASDQVSVFLALGGGWDDAASRAADNEAATRRERQHTLSGS
jgi:outer membrane protein TolC